MSKDTSSQIEDLYYTMMINKTSEERVKDTFSMFEMAQKMVIASLSPDDNVKQELFLRFYGDDFDDETKKRILERLK